MTINLINNIAFLIALAAAGQIVVSRFPESTLNRQVLFGWLFGGAALLGMANPVNFAPGVFFDGRSIVLAVAGVVGGGVTAAIAAGIGALYRYQQGGIGAPVGITIVLLSALLGVLARQWWLRRTQTPRPIDYLALGVVVQLMQLAAFTQLPNRVGYAFIEQAWWVLLLFYPPTTMLLCMMFRSYEQQLINKVALRENERLLLESQRIAHIGGWSWAFTGPIQWTDETYRIYGVSPETFSPTLEALINLHHPEDRQMMGEWTRACGAGEKPAELEFRCVWPDGTVRLVSCRGERMNDTENQSIRIVGTVQDITERKLAAEALLETQAMLARTEEIGKLGGWEFDIETMELTWTKAVYAIHEIDFIGYPTVEQGINFYTPESRPIIEQAVQRAIKHGEPFDLELEIITAKGNLRAVHTIGRHDPVGGKIVGFFQDITARKYAEAALQASLREKTALLKEVHHRVKNNLQIITSLLRLEAGRSAVPEAVDVLKAMQGRIRSMAQLHELLYRSGTFASVDLGVYLGQVVTQGFNSQMHSANLLHLKLHMGSVQVGMDQATACGLLVNELVSNCLKHGFPDDCSGQVYVELQPADPAAVQTDALWRLRVSDTGVGVPTDFEDKRKTSLGLILVEDLSQQVGGTLTIQSRPGVGAEFSVVFKALEPEALVMPP